MKCSIKLRPEIYLMIINAIKFKFTSENTTASNDSVPKIEKEEILQENMVDQMPGDDLWLIEGRSIVCLCRM